MSLVRYLRDAALLVPCYIALDWTSYIDPLGPFNITPWNPQPALAIVWMMLGGLAHAPAVFAAIALADMVIRGAPGGYAITLLGAVLLAGGYAAIAWQLRSMLRDTDLRSTRQLTVFVSVIVGGTAIVGGAFVGMLKGASLLGGTPFEAWLRFWIGDAVGILVTAPLLLAAADRGRRFTLARLARQPEALLQIAVLAASLWLIFEQLGRDPARHFYLLFLPLIWIAVRSGMNGAIVAMAIVQVGVVLGIHGVDAPGLSVLELQALVAALTLTALYLGVMVEERQRAEQSLRYSLRLAAAGEMAGAIAHEVNQPLTALANYGRAAQMLAEGGSADPAKLSEVIAKMRLEAERAGEVVRGLRDFFRLGATRLETVEARELMAAAQRVGQHAIGTRRIALEVHSGEDLPALYIDLLQVEVILRNLVANAVESIAAAKAIEGRIRIAAQREDDKLRIVVSDNGPGVPGGIRDVLFEPFTSGKPSGMGLGLAVSRAIAEAHGGSLEARGTEHGEFHLVLPCLSAG